MSSDYRNDYRGGGRGGGGHRGGRGGRGGGHHRGGHDRYNDRHHDRHDRGSDRDDRRGVPLSELDPALTELSRRVIGCAIEVHKELGPGYPIEMYRKALAIELEHEEIAFKQDHPFDVEFDEEVLGQVSAEFYIGDRFIVGLMAEQVNIGGQPRNELRAVLRAADLALGLIINFGERRLKDGLVRVLNPDKLRELAGEVDDEDDDEYEDEYEDATESSDEA